MAKKSVFTLNYYHMKNALFLISALVLTITSCKKDTISNQSDYEKSYKAWQNFKQSVNNSYTYLVNTGSFTGYSTETTITVVNGAIKSRSYKSFKLDYAGQNVPVKTLIKAWVEDSSSLNTHGEYEGAELLTLDEIYAKAKSLWLAADKSTNTIYFETKNNGLISSCGYVPNGCQDDCFNGIKISYIGANFK